MSCYDGMTIFNVQSVYYYGGLGPAMAYIANDNDVRRYFDGVNDVVVSPSPHEIEFYFDYDVRLTVIHPDGRVDAATPPEWWEKMVLVGNGRDRFRYHRPDCYVGCEVSQVFASAEAAREARVNGQLVFEEIE